MTHDTTSNVLPSGLYIWGNATSALIQRTKTYLPQLSLQAKASILADLSSVAFTQTFSNPLSTNIPELRYTFPLFDGVSVTSFTCTINGDRVIKGIVQEKREARQTFEKAAARGETAGLLEQSLNASDVFTTTIGNVPGGAKIKVDIVVLGELKHDAEIDGIRFVIPTHIAPRYGSYPSTLGGDFGAVGKTQNISIIVDVEMPTGSTISSLQSPSHPIAISIGALSTFKGFASPLPRLASASLSLGSASMDRDFILQIVATNTGNPVAILETHPTIPDQRALMAALVPKFSLPLQRPEIVFICDRSGSMGLGTGKIANLSSALQLFLKSLPLGIKFNICGFGSRHEFLFPESRPYDYESLEVAMKYAETIAADFGGTHIHGPLIDTFDRRHPDMDLEVFLLTDGQVWGEEQLFQTVNHHVEESKGAIRLFTLGIGRDVSHSLVQGLARAGRGFSQAVGDSEKMEKKVIRMLKGALTPHINDYTLEVKYKKPERNAIDDDEFDLIDRIDDLSVDVSSAEGANVDKSASTSGIAEPTPQVSTNPISLFDPNFNPDAQIESAGIKALTERLTNLPSVTVPKILQTPSEIPPLYPFNRTSVYLIMSPDMGDKSPESVILRATSKYGPLELEIPVTTTTAGETIHKLAARKAIHELEEGRGWIFHVKEKAGNVLLKDLYRDQFAAMVKREAVRLGVQFQVGGKWCSFVAVEDNDNNDDDDDDNDDNMETEISPSTIKSADIESQLEMLPIAGARGASKKRKVRAPIVSHRAREPPEFDHDDVCNSVERPRSRMTESSHQSNAGGLFATRPHAYYQSGSPPPPPPPGGLFGGLGATASQSIGSSLSLSPSNVDPLSTGNRLFGMPSQSMAPSDGGGLFGTASTSVPAPSFGPMAFGSVSTSPLTPPTAGGLFGVGAPQIMEARPAHSHQMQASQLAFGGAEGLTAPPPAGPEPEETTLHRIIRLQYFSGFWLADLQTLGAIGVTEEGFVKLLTTTRATVRDFSNTSGSVAIDIGSVAVTMAAVIFLRTQLPSEKDAWELVVDKALSWLEGVYGTEEGVGKATAEVAKIMD